MTAGDGFPPPSPAVRLPDSPRLTPSPDAVPASATVIPAPSAGTACLSRVLHRRVLGIPTCACSCAAGAGVAQLRGARNDSEVWSCSIPGSVVARFSQCHSEGTRGLDRPIIQTSGVPEEPLMRFPRRLPRARRARRAGFPSAPGAAPQAEGAILRAASSGGSLRKASLLTAPSACVSPVHRASHPEGDPGGEASPALTPSGTPSGAPWVCAEGRGALSPGDTRRGVEGEGRRERATSEGLAGPSGCSPAPHLR